MIPQYRYVWTEWGIYHTDFVPSTRFLGRRYPLIGPNLDIMVGPCHDGCHMNEYRGACVGPSEGT